MSASAPSLSIVIPAYNEEQRIPVTLQSIHTFFESNTTLHLCEIIVVDDGSTDNTVDTVKSWEEKLPMKCISFTHNCGKGAALRRGILNAQGEYVLIYDADGATPIEEVMRLYEAMQTHNSNIAIGSRVSGNQQNVEMQGYRRIIGAVYAALCRPLIGSVRDAACGCKLFEKECAQQLFSLQKINRFAYDIEILMIARMQGMTVAEVPVRWKAIAGSKVNIITDSIEMASQVARLYYRFAVSCFRNTPNSVNPIGKGMR